LGLEGEYLYVINDVTPSFEIDLTTLIDIKSPNCLFSDYELYYYDEQLQEWVINPYFITNPLVDGIKAELQVND